MLGGTYGRRVVVLAGKGNNGNDGRDAARRLRRRGVRVVEVDAHARPGDAAERGPRDRRRVRHRLPRRLRPRPSRSAPVLAVDIPTGVDGLTGSGVGARAAAERTVTFAALEARACCSPPGSELAGEIEVADIGLDTSTATASLLTDDDVAAIVPEPAGAGAQVEGGGVGRGGLARDDRRGAPRCPRRPACRSRLRPPRHARCRPRCARADRGGGHALPPADGVATCSAIWPGSAPSSSAPAWDGIRDTLDEVVDVIASAPIPLVVDGDGLHALAQSVPVVRDRPWPLVLTPHDGEYEAITGAAPAADRSRGGAHLGARPAAASCC